MLNDIRYALRVLRHSPGFTALAVLTLGLGIGATVAMFSVADAVLIRPVAYRDPDRLVQIWGQNLARNIPFYTVSYADVAIWRREARSFEALVATTGLTASLAGRGDPEVVQVTRTNAELLPMLGVTVAAGRSFLPDEDRPGASPVAVIGRELWQRRFAGDPAAVGDSIKLDGVLHTIVGVLPEAFRLPAGSVDVLVPLADDGARNREGTPPPSVMVFARLRPGVTLQQAQAEMDRLSRSLDEQFPSPVQARSVRVWGLKEFRTRDVRVSLLVLAGAVTMVLLIACVNVANLLLARAGLRRSEVATRVALGAKRRRLVFQLLTESLVIGLAGGLVGLVLAYWGVQGIGHLAPARVPSLDQAGIDLRVVGFALLASLLTVVLFGLGPALALNDPRGTATLQSSLKDQGRGHGGRLGRSVRSALVTVEVALSIVLLVGAALLIQSFARLQQVDPGFNPSGVMSASVALNADRYREPGESVAFFRRFLEELDRTPGVVAAGITSSLPLSGLNHGMYVVGESGAVTRLEDAPVTWFRRVSAGYLRAMQIPLLRGRLFDPVEERNPGTVIVNQAMAQWFWPGQDPIGRRLRGASRDPRAAGPWLTVIGMVGNVHHMALTAAAVPEMYLPYIATPSRSVMVAVRTTLKPESLAPVLTGAAKAIDPEQAVSAVRTLESAVYDATSSERLSTALLALFAALAVLLAVVGLGGVTSYLVDQRTHEIGVRMALGACRADVLRLVFRGGIVATAVGVVLGLAGAFAATRLMGAMLFGVSASSPLAFAAGPTVLVIGALVGIWLPARRATAIDPLVALREP
jgi:putative ABC transport system permease protein